MSTQDETDYRAASIDLVLECLEAAESFRDLQASLDGLVSDAYAFEVDLWHHILDALGYIPEQLVVSPESSVGACQP